MQNDYDFMAMALEEASLAYSKDEVPVGAVLVCDGRVVARAHNASITGNDPSAHAEMLVLRQAARMTRNYRLSGSELYVTLEPCIMCAGAIIQARLARVIFGARDPKSGAVVSLYQVLNDNRLNHQVAVTEGILKEECGEILSRFFQQKRIVTASIE
jgi:tRNA(adenine34) deaminase